MNTVEFAERIANMWRESRSMAGKSQDYMAKALGVSRKTIQNWEAGTASPSFRMALEWFDILGVPMYPHLMNLLYPDANMTADADISDMRKDLHRYVDELDDFHVREMLYILYGSHGSSPTGALDLLTAYLHLHMTSKVCIAEGIISNYEMTSAMGLIKDDEHVLPKTSTLKKCVSSAKSAVISGRDTYTITGDNDEH